MPVECGKWLEGYGEWWLVWDAIPYCDGPIENDIMLSHHDRTFVMRLHVDNFATISSADIELDGLTVIAGLFCETELDKFGVPDSVRERL